MSAWVRCTSWYAYLEFRGNAQAEERARQASFDGWAVEDMLEQQPPRLFTAHITAGQLPGARPIISLHCLSLFYHCLSLCLHCLSLSYHCLSLPLHCLSLCYPCPPSAENPCAVLNSCASPGTQTQDTSPGILHEFVC